MKDMNEAKMAYEEEADMLQEESDDLALPSITGRFGKKALNSLVDSFNRALEAAGFPGDYPKFDGDQTSLPTEFIRGLMMMVDAAEETGANISITLDGLTDDRGLALVAAKLDALSKSDAFKSAMSSPRGMEVEVSVEPSDEDMMMERA
jgi:hypothetical protein